jgi:hypothetical protein
LEVKRYTKERLALEEKGVKLEGNKISTKIVVKLPFKGMIPKTCRPFDSFWKQKEAEYSNEFPNINRVDLKKVYK